jgi:hypothetical protein
MDEEKRYEGTPEKKKRKKRDGLSRRPVREKKERDGSNWIFKLQKKKKRTERETERVLASRKSRKSRSP